MWRVSWRSPAKVRVVGVGCGIRGDAENETVAGQAAEVGVSATGESGGLSPVERTRLAELERVVERGLDHFLAVASALLEIREARLYREQYGSFEAYVTERFGIAGRTAYGYLEAARVAANVPAQAQLPLSHLRALAPLSAEEQSELASVISPMMLAEARRVIRAWRAERRAERAACEPPPLPAGTFRMIVADPPWRFEQDYGDGLAEDHYPSLATEEVCALPICERAAPDSHLYLWAPVSKVPDALQVCEAWGFRYLSLLTWVKPGLGLGTYWRVSTEHIVFGVRGRLPTAPNHRNWFEASRRGHSRKPEQFYELVEQASPAPYLELFARRRRQGWSVWGNETLR